MTGEIPTNLTSCSDLEILSLRGNHLVGKIPIGISSLHKLQMLQISHNNVTGRIPPFKWNLSSLTILSVGVNHLEGNIPQEMCSLENLTIMVVELNRLYGTFPSCLYNTSSLTIISSALNDFNGSLPLNMFNTLSNLQQFLIARNQFSGTIPVSIANASTLQKLDLEQNNLVGQVPGLGALHDLQWLNLQFNNLGNLSTQLSELFLGGNQILGKIPAELGNLIGLILLSLDYNHFEGVIPTTFGKFMRMQKLVMNGNKLTGEVPSIIGNLSQLYHLRIGDNMFEGNIPTKVGMLKSINEIDVSENHLSGDIPGTIGECIGLEYLYFQGNFFNETIPSSLASLKGKVPMEGVFGNVSRLVMTGNNKLCGGISEFHLQPCPAKGLKHAKHHKIKNQKPNSDSPTTDSIAKVSYQDLHKGTDGFSVKNLVGVGSFGSVYKGNLASEDKVVAVKVLNLQKNGAHKSFIAEYYKGQEFKALVFEYMNNGSLEQWLYPGMVNAGNQRMLDLDQRMGSEISTYGDMYSFGVLMLEMLTGRRPTNEMVEDDQNLHMFVHIGLACSMESPKDRMNIVDVTRGLSMIRKAFISG
ncbi:non-specific serine/threonine protein kinase [Trifolium repens]|nr:non-specific serine/threonine protein kinase [Trifolium repens]